MFKLVRKFVSIVIIVAFISTSIKAPAYAQVDPMPFMPKPGIMVHLSPEYTPAYLKGIVIHPENALKFDFIIYKGDRELTDAQKKEEYTKLSKYFLASLAIPDDDQWVNLSPYEKDRIIKDDFGKTEMGRDLLAQDYMLKQITASLIYPEDNLGKQFWNKVYAQAQEQYGTTNIPVNTFNKVWILPDDALIYEKGNTAYVLKNHLRVMLEEDYLSLQKHSGITSSVIGRSPQGDAAISNRTANNGHSLASQIIRKIVLPELEREVNEGKNFAALRQVYSGMLLATWYKHVLKESLLSKIYANKAKVKGVDQDPRTNEEIYRQYLKAYKKGVFNFIKEDMDKYTNELIPRKYFSGGTKGYNFAMIHIDQAMTPDQAQVVREDLMDNKIDYAEVAATEEHEITAMREKQDSELARLIGFIGRFKEGNDLENEELIEKALQSISIIRSRGELSYEQRERLLSHVRIDLLNLNESQYLRLSNELLPMKIDLKLRSLIRNSRSEAIARGQGAAAVRAEDAAMLPSLPGWEYRVDIDWVKPLSSSFIPRGPVIRFKNWKKSYDEGKGGKQVVGLEMMLINNPDYRYIVRVEKRIKEGNTEFSLPMMFAVGRYEETAQDLFTHFEKQSESFLSAINFQEEKMLKEAEDISIRRFGYAFVDPEVHRFKIQDLRDRLDELLDRMFADNETVQVSYKSGMLQKFYSGSKNKEDISIWIKRNLDSFRSPSTEFYVTKRGNQLRIERKDAAMKTPVPSKRGGQRRRENNFDLKTVLERFKAGKSYRIYIKVSHEADMERSLRLPNVRLEGSTKEGGRYINIPNLESDATFLRGQMKVMLRFKDTLTGVEGTHTQLIEPEWISDITEYDPGAELKENVAKLLGQLEKGGSYRIYIKPQYAAIARKSEKLPVILEFPDKTGNHYFVIPDFESAEFINSENKIIFQFFERTKKRVRDVTVFTRYPNFYPMYTEWIDFNKLNKVNPDTNDLITPAMMADRLEVDQIERNPVGDILSKEPGIIYRQKNGTSLLTGNGLVLSRRTVLRGAGASILAATLGGNLQAAAKRPEPSIVQQATARKLLKEYLQDVLEGKVELNLNNVEESWIDVLRGNEKYKEILDDGSRLIMIAFVRELFNQMKTAFGKSNIQQGNALVNIELAAMQLMETREERIKFFLKHSLPRYVSNLVKVTRREDLNGKNEITKEVLLLAKEADEKELRPKLESLINAANNLIEAPLQRKSDSEGYLLARRSINEYLEKMGYFLDVSLDVHFGDGLHHLYIKSYHIEGYREANIGDKKVNVAIITGIDNINSTMKNGFTFRDTLMSYVYLDGIKEDAEDIEIFMKTQSIDAFAEEYDLLDDRGKEAIREIRATIVGLITSEFNGMAQQEIVDHIVTQVVFHEARIQIDLRANPLFEEEKLEARAFAQELVSADLQGSILAKWSLHFGQGGILDIATREVLQDLIERANARGEGVNIKDLKGNFLRRPDFKILNQTLKGLAGLASSKQLGPLAQEFLDKAVIVPKTQATDQAMVPGGIDFNAAHLNLQIKRDGQGVPLPYDQQDMAQLNLIEGLEPVILSIKPANGLPVFSELLKSVNG